MVDSQREAPYLRVRIDEKMWLLAPDREWVVGRSKQADLMAEDNRISRRHLTLRYRALGWTMTDAGSRNGVWSEGEQVAQYDIPATGAALNVGGPEGPVMTLMTVDADVLARTVSARLPRPGTAPPVPQPDPQSTPLVETTDTRPAGSASSPADQQPCQSPAAAQQSPAAAQPQRPHQPPAAPPQPGGFAAPPVPPAPSQPSGYLAAWPHEAARPQQLVPQQLAPPDQYAAPYRYGASHHYGAPTANGPGPQEHSVLPYSTEPTRPSGFQVYQLRLGRQTIGRQPDNDILLGELLVSGKHAAVDSGPDGVWLIDLHSDNGTYVNGHKITRYQLSPGDTITIGPHRLAFDGHRLWESLDIGDVRFSAWHLNVRLPNGTKLLNDVSFNLPPRTVMAIVGPSGAGKSTALGALTGARPATSGDVFYAGRDLYDEYDDLRQRIGFVPQQDILHSTLTVGQALEYGARLRFPAGTGEEERATRIREVAAELRLTNQLHTPIAQLNGSERKRASIAIELLTKPSLLFLDEPTSELDADLDREVMNLLRSLADNSRTVVVITHDLEHLDNCDLVMLLARGGHVAYLGPPSQATAYFGVSTWADIFALLKTQPGAQWSARFAATQNRDPRSFPPAGSGTSQPRASLAPIHRQPARTQFRTLVRRHLAVTAANRTLLAIIILLPTVLALIAHVVQADHGLSTIPGNRDARQLLLVLIVGAALAGSAGAVRELVKERAIYQRERAVGLSLGAYLASKVTVLSAIAIGQSVILSLLALAGRPTPDSSSMLPSGTEEIVIAVALTAAVSTALGLLISALVRNENQAIPLLILIALAQLVLCGALVPLSGRPGLEQVSLLLPSRWGFAAVASTVDLHTMERSTEDSLWNHGAFTWFSDVGGLVVLAVACLALVVLLLRRLDPDRRPDTDGTPANRTGKRLHH